MSFHLSQLDPNIVNQLISYYQTDHSIREVAKVFRLSRGSVTKILLQNNCRIKTRGEILRLFNDEEALCIKERYLLGESSGLLAKTFNCSDSTILAVLTKLDINRDRKNRIKIKKGPIKQRRQIDTSFFESIDTEKKAYWLGFLFANGCISKRSSGGYRGFCVGLKRTDREHLIKLNSDLKSTYKISDSSNEEKAFLSISSPKMAIDLIKLGVIPRKSYVSSFIPAIQEDLKRHFWRGFIDGDGWIFKYNLRYWVIGLCGTFETLSAFKTFVDNLKPTKVKIRALKGCYSITFGSFPVVKELIRVLYEDCSVFLTRKRQQAEELLCLPI